MSCTLFINAYTTDVESQCFSVDIESLIAVYVYQIANSPSINIKIKLSLDKTENCLINADFSKISYSIIASEPLPTIDCKWPVIYIENSAVVAGLCSVSRFLIKYSENVEVRKLLGFREASLMACSESSIWTRFCEIDMTRTVKDLLKFSGTFLNSRSLVLPEDVARFEYHLQQPVRMHNVYKEARLKNNNKDITSSTPISDLNLEHCYGEGPVMTIADIILYQCFQIFFTMLPFDNFERKLPLICSWYKKMSNCNLPQLKISLFQQPESFEEIIEPNFIKQSLYTADPARYRPERRIYTKQNDIEMSLNRIAVLSNEIVNGFLPYGYEIEFQWDDVPLDANPNGGALPVKRAARKCLQLENLAKAIVKLCTNKQFKIVDFCSGSGHLGILLAHLLPDCKIILVENKEHSLARAKQRIKTLGLTNITIIQSNLDYFIGTFDIGVSLHACGVATDLVIETCIQNRAHFVSCPCCYGGIRNCHHLQYPRSKQFQDLELGNNYFNLAHAADQTHETDNVKTKQGFQCMDIIDTDRKFYAENFGYKVFLGKLQPVTCTNKNNLLVGIFNGK